MARLFDGNTANYLYTDTTLSAARPITFMCWFNASGSLTTTMTMMYFGDKDATATRNLYMLRLRGSGESIDPSEVDFTFANSSTFSHVPSGATYTSAGTWAFAAGIGRSSGTGNTAVLNTSGFPGGGSILTPSGADRIAIGLDASTDINPWNGMLAEAAIWNTELSQAELLLLYSKRLSPLFMKPSNLIFYAPLIRDEDNDLFGGSLTLSGSLTSGNHIRVVRPSQAYI